MNIVGMNAMIKNATSEGLSGLDVMNKVTKNGSDNSALGIFNVLSEDGAIQTTEKQMQKNPLLDVES